MPIKLKAKPTFNAKVSIPAPESPLVVEFTFRHKTKAELTEYSKPPGDGQSRTDVDMVMAIVVDWLDFEVPFNAENLGVFFENYHAAPRAIVETYMQELTQVKLGN